MAGFAMRNHRVSADRRLARTEGFGREEIIRAFSAGGRCRTLVAATLSHRRRAGCRELVKRADADIPDDAFLISPDWRGLNYIRGLGPNFRRITYQPNVPSLKSKAALHDRSAGAIRTTPSRGDRGRRVRRAGSGVSACERAGQHHAGRPSQPPSIPAAIVSSRHRVIGDIGDRLADPLSAARSPGGHDPVRHRDRGGCGSQARTAR